MLIEEVVPVVTQKQVLVMVDTSQVHMQREVSAVEAVMQGQTSAGEKARSKIRGSWSKGGVVKKWPQETAGTEVDRNDELSQCSSDGWMTVTRTQKGRAGQRQGEADLHQHGRQQNGHVASVAPDMR